MAYCPECMVEYSEGSPECIDCHLPLERGAPPAREIAMNHSDCSANDELVRVRTFTGRGGRLDAQLAREILKTEGIPCVLPGERAPDIYPATELVQLLVFKKDAARAAEILQNYLDNPPNSPPEDESHTE
jgi:hypothetical protein